MNALLDSIKDLLKRVGGSVIFDKKDGEFLDDEYGIDGDEYAIYAKEIYLKGERIYAKCARAYSDSDLYDTSFTEEYLVNSRNIENIKDEIYYSLVQLGTKYETESATEEDESIILLKNALSNIPGRSLPLSAVVLVEENDDYYASEENSEDSISYVAKKIFLNGNNDLFASGFINYDYIGADGGRFCEPIDKEMAETLLEDIDKRTYQIIKDNAAEWEKKSIIRKDLAMRVAALPDLPPYLVKELSHISNPDIRARIASREDIPSDILGNLLKDSDPFVKRAALINSIEKNLSLLPEEEWVFLIKEGPLRYNPEDWKLPRDGFEYSPAGIFNICNVGVTINGKRIFVLADRLCENKHEVDSKELRRILSYIPEKEILVAIHDKIQGVIKNLIMNKQADYSCNLNNCQAVYPGTQDKLWNNPPYLVTDVKYNEYYKGLIKSITIKNGNGNSTTFPGDMIDVKNRLVFEQKDMTIKYGIETGKAEFYPHLKKSETQAQAVQHKPKTSEPPKSKHREMHM